MTCDSAETDLDLGHYERFLDIECTRANSTLAGKLLQKIINRERCGEYKGKTVQMVPHFTDAIQEAIRESSVGSDFHIIEIGGTVGDYESLPFVEAIRGFSQTIGTRNCFFIHVVYIPFLGTSKEFKTKPAQNAINDLRGFGIMPNCIVARCEEMPSHDIRPKLSLFGGVSLDNIIIMPNAKTVYSVPVMLYETGIIDRALEGFGISTPKENTMDSWFSITENAMTCSLADTCTPIKIGIIAKYLDNEDTYFSVIESLRFASWKTNTILTYEWIDAESLESEKEGTLAILDDFDGILIPGGFGSRGVEGMIRGAGYCLVNNVPYLGICLGLQVAVIAAARTGGVPDANSTEIFSDTKSPVIYIMEGQTGKESTGGTLRLGNQEAMLIKGTKTYQLYGREIVIERHRHRYEVNTKFSSAYTKGGIMVSGTSVDGTLVEFIEANNITHPFFLATQSHPEFLSRPNNPHPLFLGFIEAIKKRVL